MQNDAEVTSWCGVPYYCYLPAASANQYLSPGDLKDQNFCKQPTRLSQSVVGLEFRCLLGPIHLDIAMQTICSADVIRYSGYTCLQAGKMFSSRISYVRASRTQQTSTDRFTNPRSSSAWQQHTRAVHGATGPDKSAALILPAPRGLPPGCLHFLSCMKPASITHAQSLQHTKKLTASISLDCPLLSTYGLKLCAGPRGI